MSSELVILLSTVAGGALGISVGLLILRIQDRRSGR